MGGDGATRSSGRHRVLVAAVSVAMFLAALVAGRLVFADDADEPDGVRAELVSACRRAGPGLPDGVCECAVDRLVVDLPEEDLAELASAAPDERGVVLDAAVAPCVAGVEVAPDTGSSTPARGSDAPATTSGGE